MAGFWFIQIFSLHFIQLECMKVAFKDKWKQQKWFKNLLKNLIEYGEYPKTVTDRAN